MLISLATLRLLAGLGDRVANDALDDLAINGLPGNLSDLAGRLSASPGSPWLPWWCLPDEILFSGVASEIPKTHWDRSEMLN